MFLGLEFIGRYRKKYFWMNSSFLIVLAALIGMGSGFAAIGFKELIGICQVLFFGGGERFFSSALGHYYIILIPALGGFLVGPLVYFLAREAKGHGVPEVMAAVAEKGGVLRPRLVIVKALASAITIGSGGSAGREGPIVQISSAIGSTIGQLLKMKPETMKTLVACGAAGGVSATFNAPMGGVLFAQEVILGNFSTDNFILIVISSVISAIISRIFWGDSPAFIVHAYGMVSPVELFFYLGLGIITGVFAFIYIKTLYKSEDFFDSITVIPDWVKPVIGGLLVGCIGLYFPQVFGVGYKYIENVLANQFPWYLVVSLLLFKLLATSLTIGSGGSGGVFAPSLFMGSMLGGSFGFLINQSSFAAFSAPPGAYALVGMAGVFAGVSQAPITGILIVFEMTGDYKVVLPLMITCVISSLVARGLHPESIYTEKLARRGLNVKKRKDIDLMATIPVEKVMTRNVITIDVDTNIVAARNFMLNYAFSGFPVEKNHNLMGLITYEDVYNQIKKGETEGTIESLTRNKLVTVTPADSLRTAIEIMARNDIGRIPVVDVDNPGKIVGIISRSDIIKAYYEAIN